MAKLGPPIDPGQLAALAARYIVPRGEADTRTGRAPAPYPEAWINAGYMKGTDARACRAAWRQLATWKKYRWALCAWKHGVVSNDPTSGEGRGGFGLFTKCWMEQRPRKHLLPVSPCVTITVLR